MSNKKKPNVVVIGGGTGSFVVLSGLRDFDLNLTALITMMDSGGSTGRLRDQLGVLPPGDLRQVLVALSSSQKIWRDLFVYRFESGDLDGHNFGNIFLSSLEKITGSIEEALDLASELLDTKGEVVPITFDKNHLCVRLEDGSIIKGEAFIDIEEHERPKIIKSFLEGRAKPNPKAIVAIKNADFIVVGPGDLYTSIVPNLLVDGVAAVYKKSKATKIYICNLMTKVGQTDGFSASDHVRVIKKYTNDSGLDYVLISKSSYPKKALKVYEDHNTFPVDDDLGRGKEFDVRVVRRDLVSDVVFKKGSSDRVKRSLIRHDPEKLFGVLKGIFVDSKPKK